MAGRCSLLSPIVLLAVALGGCGGGSDSSQSPGPPPPPPPPPAAGLDVRPDNASCVAGDRPSQAVSLRLERTFPALPAFASPVLMLQAPRDATRWFVVEQAGVVRSFTNETTASSTGIVLDIRARVIAGGEAGLLGFAFHPDFPADPRAYVSYTHPGDRTYSRLSEFRSRDGGRTLDPASETVLFSVAQPAGNHNGGHVVFGPDGFLYFGLGDGGSGGDPWGTIGNGQELTTTLGKLLRFDVAGGSSGVAYRIPAGNPYAGNLACAAGTSPAGLPCPEIYAYGFRNPWRWSFDRGSGELWVADVGQDAFEEVNRVVAGGNYGWRCFEGTASFNANCGPNAASSLPPVVQYGRTVGRSVTGGYVYRGSALPALAGRYVFGDFVTGRLWHVPRDVAPTLTVNEGLDTGLSIAAFGEGLDGELFVVNYSGTLHRLVAGATAGGTVATRLSATGCVLASDPARPAAGLVPYAPNAPFWSDGAAKERHLALPNGATLRAGADGDLEFPNGSVLLKHFRLGGRLVETRLFMRHTDGEWAGYTYEWNAEGTDATRVVGGKSVSVNGQSWVFPSEAQCLACHTAAAGRSLGLELAQLNGSILYPQTGRSANQVVTLNAIGLFSPPVVTAPASLPRMPDPYGAAGTPGERARAWLHTNCAHCHRPGGGTPTDLDLRYTTPLAVTQACDRVPQAGDLGIANARILAPGAAARSVLVARAATRGSGAMPPLASTVVDADGVALLGAWVNSLAGCN